MDLLYLHGPPASGKLTVATAIQDITAAPVFDNHVAIDFALSLFPFGTRAFWDLVVASRVLALGAAGRSGTVPLVITTCCYALGEDSQYQEILEAVTCSGGRVLPVFFSCSLAVRLQRVENETRALKGKISSKLTLAQADFSNTFVPVPSPDVLSLSTERASPADTAAAILHHFDIRPLHFPPVAP